MAKQVIVVLMVTILWRAVLTIEVQHITERAEANCLYNLTKWSLYRYRRVWGHTQEPVEPKVVKLYARSLLGTPFNSTLGDALEKENCELKCSRKKSTRHSEKAGWNTTEQALSSHATSNYMQEWASAAPLLRSPPVASGTPMCWCLHALPPSSSLYLRSQLSP